MNERKKQATIIDVAARAGVSWATVSRVVNGESIVRPKTAERVNAAILELGFKPNAAARSLKTAKAFLIGILIAGPSPHYIIELIRGATPACRMKGYHLTLEELDADAPDLVEEFERSLLSASFDGVIVTPPLTDSPAILDLLDKHGVSYVRIDPETDPERSDRIGASDERGVFALARHFWELGHRRFGLVNGRKGHHAAPIRRTAFLDAIKQLGGDSGAVLEVDGDFFFASGFEGGKQLLDRDDRPTAIFATNDEMAVGVVAAAGQLGLRVPFEIAVAGFDDSDVAGYVWPPLTTIHQPIADMGRIAVEMLIDKNADSKPRVIELQVDLIVRQSTTG